MNLAELDRESIKVILNGKEYLPSVVAIQHQPLCWPELQITVPIPENVGNFSYKSGNKYVPRKILRSGPCTIVFWEDGTKTMVRRSEDEVDDDYSAFTAALAIKIFGSNSAVKRTVKNNLVDQIKKTKKHKNNS